MVEIMFCGRNSLKGRRLVRELQKFSQAQSCRVENFHEIARELSSTDAAILNRCDRNPESGQQ